MASEPVNTLIQTKYAEQLEADLARNQSEQATLTARLAQLQSEEKWLAATLQSMPPAGPDPASAQGSTEPVGVASTGGAEAAAVPQPRVGKKAGGSAAVKKTAARKTTAKKTTAAAKKAVAAKKANPAKKSAPAKKAVPAAKGAKAAGPTLGQLLADMLSGQPGEPKKVSEIRTELEAAHPERAKSDPIVRSALDKLASKGVLDKNTQQGTVFYTWPTPENVPAPAADVPVQENAEAVPAGA
ncbi:hypothetical protein [Streptomyces sp. NPDC058861]|uniref:hypothetical protein n=1 Tax=Streptomyces sp. NPDC058861 TaxID=3346653 RepID=UPI0036BD77FB